MLCDTLPEMFADADTIAQALATRWDVAEIPILAASRRATGRSPDVRRI